MGWFRPDRGARADDRFLRLKLALFGAGAVATMLGLGLEQEWLITAALVLFVTGFLLRFYPRREPPPD